MELSTSKGPREGCLMTGNLLPPDDMIRLLLEKIGIDRDIFMSAINFSTRSSH